ncbi:hypothetical protein [Candidatus Culexarchaeum yellowstonense]|uniref:hypothetical protein n=1 Tax=Candidatus Culexarchaeum yellowstonense TaxID=2928963 RepID=UPI0026EE6F9B|nr:hypothetical protein [Candidatus Culexarchaeum yellowstonense]
MRCKHYDECLKYSEMTLDSSALNCEGCPAYEKTNIYEVIKHWLVRKIGLDK